MAKFQIHSKYYPSGDQPQAIAKITDGFKNKNYQTQVLLGATGTGKTFTMAHIITNLQKKTLILAHNKTLAAQLCAELKEFLPHNHVEYFVSTFDFYQPEAYVIKTNTYIEKNSQTNKDIEMLNLSALNALVTAQDVVVVASVAAIYASVPPREFINNSITLKLNQNINLEQLQQELVRINYVRNDYEITHGRFSVKGDVIEIGPGNSDLYHYRISLDDDLIEEIAAIDPLTKTKTKNHRQITLPSANLYTANPYNLSESLQRIRDELKITHKEFMQANKLIEAQRIQERVNHDLESLEQFGFCNGIENYARHLELRNKGETPYTIFDYFGNDWLLIVDESHMMLPQIQGMYHTDKNRKLNLVNYGFRLPSALDNRPLNFSEFLNKTNLVLYVSATPNQWEIKQAQQVVEQIIRPTGLVDPTITIEASKDQIIRIEEHIRNQIKKKARTFVVVLTIRMAEELTDYLMMRKIKVAYLHNELKTLERTKIIHDLRRGIYDVIVGINLLREGLDVPEVSLVLILDADKPGFFRSTNALIQIIGRASRHIEGKVIMYADVMTEAMAKAIAETNRRRKLQITYNQKHNIIPQTIQKPIPIELNPKELKSLSFPKTKKDKKQQIIHLRQLMHAAARKQEYEKAAYYRDIIIELEAN